MLFDLLVLFDVLIRSCLLVSNQWLAGKKVFLSHFWSDQGLDKNKTNEKRLAWYWVVRVKKKENWDYNKNATKTYKKLKLYNLTIIKNIFEDFQNRSLTDFFALLENDQLSLEHRTNVKQYVYSSRSLNLLFIMFSFSFFGNDLCVLRFHFWVFFSVICRMRNQS